MTLKLALHSEESLSGPAPSIRGEESLVDFNKS